MEKKWIESGKGPKGSVFVEIFSGKAVQAIKLGKSLSGLQAWELYDRSKIGLPTPKIVYVKRKKELYKILNELW